MALINLMIRKCLFDLLNRSELKVLKPKSEYVQISVKGPFFPLSVGFYNDAVDHR